MTFHADTRHSDTRHADTRRGPSRHARNGQWEFRLVFAATFLVMLVPTVLARLMLSRAGDAGSIFHEASARADRIVPFMFMG